MTLPKQAKSRHERGSGCEGLPDDQFFWRVDPTDVALDVALSRRRQPGSPDLVEPGCREVGRRELLLQFTFSQWVLRRVEKVSFSSDRRVARSSSIELKIPDETPVLVTDDLEPHWLVPLSVMRRKTLVNLELSDEDGRSISMLGVRFTQQVDESMLLAVAELSDSYRPSLDVELRKFVSKVISGDFEVVTAARQRFIGAKNDSEDDELRDIFRDVVFRATLERLWHNFTLYVLLPVRLGRHRVLRLAFEEQLTWRFQTPELTAQTTHRKYMPMNDFEPRHKHWADMLAWRATRIRFLTPSAENCSSYHFEFTAPTGLGIQRAAFLAGRPNDSADSRVGAGLSWDQVDNPGHSVGLHAVEVHNGSLCRAQVDLRIPSRGWLGTMAAACFAIALLMTSVAFHSHLLNNSGHWTTGEITNIVVLLVGICAGAATYVAQQHATDVVARLASGVRALGLVAICVPAATAIGIVYVDRSPVKGWRFVRDAGLTWVMAAISIVIAAIVIVAWARVLVAERSVGHQSLWDMTTVPETTADEATETIGAASSSGADGAARRMLRSMGQRIRDGAGWLLADPDFQFRSRPRRPQAPLHLDGKSFDEMVDTLGFGTSAVGVYSSEGWHERYGWDRDRQEAALARLRMEERQERTLTCRCGITSTS